MFHQDYENYAAETRCISEIRRSGGMPATIAGYRISSPSYGPADARFRNRVRLDRAAMMLHDYEHDERLIRALDPDQRSAAAVGEQWGFSAKQVKDHENYLFSSEGAHELFLAEEWSEGEGFMPFHRALERVKDGKSVGRPAES